jgi:RNA polymerase sigma factor (sigma-70 family)
MTDQEILTGFQQKDRLLYENISIYVWRTFAPKVLGMVLKNSGTSDDANDLFSEIFLKVQKSIVEGKYQHQDLFANYFMKIAKRTWLDELRRRASDRRRTWEKLDSDDDYLQLLDTGEADIVEYVLFNEKWSKIHKVWHQWKDTICQTRLIQFHLEGLLIRKIAELESTTERMISEATMRRRMVRCRDKFVELVNEWRG